MSFKPRPPMTPATALAAVLALAGPFVAPTGAAAQEKPYADTGSYAGVGQPDLSPGTSQSYTYDVDRQYNDIAAKDPTRTEISPDVQRPEGPSIDDSTRQAALEKAAMQQGATMQRRKLSHQSERFFDDYREDSRKLWIVPYLEASQVVESQVAPQGNTFTYSVLAAGVDGGVAGPNHQGSLSLRYERRIGWGNAESYDNFSGVGHGRVAVIPGALNFEVAGYANRVHVEDTGATTNTAASPDALTQVYTVMAGPSLVKDAGDVEIRGHYRIGYSHVGTPSVLNPAPGQSRADIFDHSFVQDAKLRVGIQPGDTTPVGLAVEGGHYAEDISNLDQRARDSHIRGEVTIPVADAAALVGGVGYEWTRVDSRDALRDAAGNPVLSAKGRLLTDYAGPRYIAFDTEGLIWDAGVIWRPSPKTNLEAHIGRRYGEFGGYGTFSYKPTRRSTFNVLVYDNMAGFGGLMTNSLANLPTQFTSIRDSLTGNISACVNSSSGGNCLTGAVATVRSTVFRGRGAAATYNWAWNRFQAGVGLGWDRRQYIAAPGTALAALDGKVERYAWIAAYLNAAIDQDSNVTTMLDAYSFHSNVVNDGDFNAVRATAIYQHRFTRHLSGSAAVGIDTINRKALDEIWTMSGQVGMRYSF